MISPGNRLLLWTVFWLIPAAALTAFPGSYGPIGWACVAFFCFLVAVDAAMGTRVFDGLSVETSEVVRVSKDRPGELEITFHNSTKRARPLKCGFPWPREIETENDELLTRLPAESETARVTWKFTPRKRGNYRMDRCYLESPSPIGFWNIRRPSVVSSEIRVYPNLLGERRQVAAIFLNRGTFGIHAQRQVGKGRDFEKLREYIPGDSYDEIHWKATAKRGKPVTKIFQIERTQEVYVIVDSSRLSAREMEVPGVERGEKHVTTLERFITAGLVLGLAAERQGDLFGLMTFSDQTDRFIPAKNGKAHYAHCRDALYTLEPRRVSPDFDEMAAFLRVRLRRRALLVFLTSLDDPVLAEQFNRAMELLSRQHLILVNMLPPPNVKPLFTGNNVSSVDDIYRDLGGHLRWQELRGLEKRLSHHGVDLSLLKNEQMSAQLVSQYLSVKRRQAI